MIEAGDLQTSPEATPLPAPAPRCRILVIDDSSFVRKLLKVILTDMDCEVVTAADGLSGLELALEGRFQIVIVDNVLPVMNGREVCRRLTELPAGQKPLTIFQSVNLGSYEDRSEALASGADILMRKEPGAENIVARVRRFLETRPHPESLSS